VDPKVVAANPKSGVDAPKGEVVIAEPKSSVDVPKVKPVGCSPKELDPKGEHADPEWGVGVPNVKPAGCAGVPTPTFGLRNENPGELATT
jgi:hypothetical protein